MESYVIFPETSWQTSELGFSGIKDICDLLQEKDIKFTISRQYQSIVIEINNLNKQIIDLIKNKLPNDFKIPILWQGIPYVISSKQIVACNEKNKDFNKLMQDAHLSLSKEKKIDKIPSLTLEEINNLCNNFYANDTNFDMSFLNIEEIYYSININDIYKHKLKGLLIDIKIIWTAINYDTFQLANNTEDLAEQKFKRYIYINNLIVRIRALWEKLIGVAILLEQPYNFDKILSSIRVRKRFINECKDSKNQIVKIIWDYTHSLDVFEERYRTPELHKIGRTIRWSTKKLGQELNRLLAYRNDLNYLLRKVVNLFKGYNNNNF